MKTLFIFLTGFTFFCFGEKEAVVKVSNGLVDLNGVFIRNQVLVTVAHGLGNNSDGGLTLSDGTKSTAVVFDRSVDIAFVIFPYKEGRKTLPVWDSKDENPKKADTYSATSLRSGRELLLLDRQDAKGRFAYVETSNTESRFTYGDSGSALYSDKGKLIGVLTGGSPAEKNKIAENLRFVVISSTAGLEVYKKAYEKFPKEFAARATYPLKPILAENAPKENYERKGISIDGQPKNVDVPKVKEEVECTVIEKKTEYRGGGKQVTPLKDLELSSKRADGVWESAVYSACFQCRPSNIGITPINAAYLLISTCHFSGCVYTKRNERLSLTVADVKAKVPECKVLMDTDEHWKPKY